MPMLVVRGVAEGPSVVHRAEPFRERRAVLQGLELGFGVRIVVGDVRAGVRPDDPEVNEQLRDRLGGHRGATVGMHDARGDPTRAMVSAMSPSASSADSPGATSQPGAYRL
jgi:hypothetical protein